MIRLEDRPVTRDDGPPWVIVWAAFCTTLAYFGFWYIWLNA